MTISEIWEQTESLLHLFEIVGGRCYPKYSTTGARRVIFQVRKCLARIDQLLLAIDEIDEQETVQRE